MKEVVRDHYMQQMDQLVDTEDSMDHMIQRWSISFITVLV